jgi:hypothetical protein
MHMGTDNLQRDREHLEDILNRDEFLSYMQEAGSNPILEWLGKIWNQIWDLFPETMIQPQSSTTVAYLIVILILIALGGVIFWLVRNMILLRLGRKYTIFKDEDELGKTALTLLREAEEYARQENYLEAIRHQFLVLLVVMNEREWIQAEKWKTNYEYRQELSVWHPEAVGLFSQVAKLFEEAYYGRGTVGVREYRRMAELIAPYAREGVAAHEE